MATETGASGAGAGKATIVATVVTYNPGPELAEHLLALRGQADQVVVVDNGSANVEAVREACARTGSRLIANAANLGIAAALNQGAAEAMAAGAEWLAMFDQDSLAPAAALPRLLEVVARHPQSARIGIAAMTHGDRGTGRSYHAPSDVLQEQAGWRLLRTTITSGSLVRCAVLREVGGFDEPLFIDFVDHEFCLRMRRHGWLVMEASDLVLEHSMGASRVHNVLGFQTVLTHHSPLRRYYITRNQLEVCTRNLLFDPLYCTRCLAHLLASTLFLLVLEEQRVAKLRAVLRAVFHFATRRAARSPGNLPR